MHTRKKWAAAAAAALMALPGLALDLRPDAVQLLAGPGRDATGQAGAGLVWDWGWLRQRGTLLNGQTEFIVSHWRADAPGGGGFGLQQFTLLPMLRLQGSSPWYAEIGVGATYLSKDYVTPQKTFSTRWNFHDVIGAGYRFGAERRHEIGLRVLHVSNAGIKRPNPGEEFLLLRYAYRY